MGNKGLKRSELPAWHPRRQFAYRVNRVIIIIQMIAALAAAAVILILMNKVL